MTTKTGKIVKEDSWRYILYILQWGITVLPCKTLEQQGIQKYHLRINQDQPVDLFLKG